MDTQIDNLINQIKTWGIDAIEYLPNLIGAILVFFIFIYISSRVAKVVNKTIKRADNIPANVIKLLTSISRIIVIIIGFVIALSLLNLSQTVSSVLAGLGIVGLALGFAFQNVAANFISGIIMAFNRHVEIGDIIEINGEFGTIIGTSLRATTLEKPNGSLLIVPNKIVFESSFINHSDKPYRRVDIDSGISYDDELSSIEPLVKKAISTVPNLNKDLPIRFLFTEFADSSINFNVNFWITTNDYDEYLQAKNDAIIAIKNTFDKNNITIPYPIRVIENIYEKK